MHRLTAAFGVKVVKGDALPLTTAAIPNVSQSGQIVLNRQTGQEKSDDTPDIPHYASQAVHHYAPPVAL
ncbi:hypothetical protein WH50_10230 [Pokkaliibacter plantistimulans]|uniref:Uncharacterized protein n=1 Tax=Pokkaliibacter plantistimulans TaxID=1635171 RepID=A0ABX5LXH3_9GAMM|nr:hypothetical protein WH50_10230 [Pokkaliibacter plantistimulans]